MTKKIINIDEMAMGWEQVYPMLYYAVLNNYDDRVQEAEFHYGGKLFDVTIFLDNIRLLINDNRWLWPADRTPYEVLREVPLDRRWTNIVDLGQNFRCKEQRKTLEEESGFQGVVNQLRLRPSMDYCGIGPGYYTEMQPHLVIAFDNDDDHVFWMMKHA